MSFYRNDDKYEILKDLITRQNIYADEVFVEPEEYEHDENNFYPNRCFYYCNLDKFNNKDVDSNYCIGFSFTGNYTEYKCYFINGNFMNIHVFNPRDGLQYYILKEMARFIQPDFSPPSAPLSPTVSIETLILEPEILIPLITGSVIFVILFIFIFRLCTKERADSFIRVFNTITRRKNNKIVVDTSKKVKVKQAVRK